MVAIGLFQLLADLARRVVAVLAGRSSSSRPAPGGSSSISDCRPERGAEHLLGFLGVLAARCFGGFLGEAGAARARLRAPKGKFRFMVVPFSA
jgi:hypothetical protein